MLQIVVRLSRLNPTEDDVSMADDVVEEKKEEEEEGEEAFLQEERVRRRQVALHTLPEGVRLQAHDADWTT